MAKPKCSDFIVAAIRAIRASGPKMKGVKPGVAIRRLWSVTSEAYSEKQFREALEELLKSNIVAAAWKLASGTTYEGVGGRLESSFRSLGVYRIDSIPEKLPLDGTDPYWYRHDGEFFKREEREKYEKYEVMDSLRLYVVADGLPKKVPRKNGRKTSHKKTAKEIIAAMKRSQQ